MVIRLLPEDISKNWDLIRAGVLTNPSPFMSITPQGMRNILKNLLAGTIQCWASIGKNQLEQEVVNGFILTNIAEEFITNSKFLNIYDLYVVGNVGAEEWKEGLVGLEEFARANGCNKITAYTNVPTIGKLAVSFGFDISTRFMFKEVS